MSTSLSAHRSASDSVISSSDCSAEHSASSVVIESTPRTESLEDTMQRALPLWRERIEPDLRSGKTVLVVAHGNSLRGLVKHVDGADSV